MQLIDTHCHINTMVKDEFDVPLPKNFIERAQPILRQAAASHVTTIINVGTSLVESTNCILLAKQFDNCFATVGIHPNDISENWGDDLEKLASLLSDTDNKIVGIGEIGLDYHYPGYNKKLQYTVLKEQIALACKHNLPIVIHTRDANCEVLAILETMRTETMRGVIHCFSEDLAFAKRAIELNFVLGIGGPLTYPKNEELRRVFKEIPLEKIVLETDAPFLPPQAIRGKRNSPASIKLIAQYLAELRGISVEDVAATTTQTARTLFRL